MTIENAKEKKQFKTLNIIRWFFTIIILLFAIFMVIFTLLSSTKINNKKETLFGYSLFIVWSDSMKKTDFAAGDLIIVKETDTKKLNVGDIITFESTSQMSFGDTITHKIKEINKSDSGEFMFTTYGTSNGEENVDDTPVYESNIIGKYCGKIPSFGYFANFLKEPLGYVLCILLPCVMLVVMQMINIGGAISQKRKIEKADLDNQRGELAAKHEQIAAELLEAENLKKELEELKKKILDSKESENNNKDS